MKKFINKIHSKETELAIRTKTALASKSGEGYECDCWWCSGDKQMIPVLQHAMPRMDVSRETERIEQGGENRQIPARYA